MNEQILLPTEVHAYRIGNESKITIVASGHEDGFTNIKITTAAAQIFPPIYMVVGEPTPAIGYFPYTVSLTVEYGTETDFVYFQMEGGTKKIPIEILKGNAPEATATTAGRQVVGYAYNSTDINVAIKDAVAKLQKQTPGNVNAVIKTSGFVGAGLPIGIAYFYVIMEA